MEPLVAHGEEVEYLRFGPTRVDLLTASRSNVAAWRLDRSGAVSARRFVSDDPFLRGVDLSPDGTLLAVTDNSTRLYVLDPRTLQPRRPPIVVGNVDLGSSNVAFSLDGRRVVVDPVDSVLTVDVATGVVRDPPLKLSDALADIAVSAGGRLAVGVFLGSENAFLVDWERWTVVRRVSVEAPRPGVPQSGAVSLSPDGRLLALGTASGAVVVEETSGAHRSTLMRRPGNIAGSVDFSADGRYLAAGFSDGRAQLFDVRTRRPIGDLLAGSGGVEAVRFSPGGRLLAVLGAGGGVVLWDVATRRRIGDVLSSHTRSAKRGVFSRDGKALFTISSDGSVIRWNLDPAAWTKRACELAARNLSQAEWTQFIGDAEPYRKTCPDLPSP
jgi:WD40 repeat protein